MASSPAIYHPRRPRASPLWHIVHRGWDDFVSGYEKKYRPAMGPLRPKSVAAVQAFSPCGDLAAGFTRLVCAGCSHQHLLAFTCKARHLCHACHQRRTLQIAHWISQPNSGVPRKSASMTNARWSSIQTEDSPGAKTTVHHRCPKDLGTAAETSML
ncbi:MAG: transposase zinc-binding domain-containing protein [Verrucomicrobiales bacterium]